VSSSLLAEVNTHRSRHGLQPLGIDPTLGIAAQRHADWMARVDRLDHTGEGGSSFVDRIRAAGPYPSNTVSENIACGQQSASECVGDWLASRGHRANMLGVIYHTAGCGSAQAADGRWYWCAVFGAAKTGAPSPVPAPPKPTRPSFTDWVLRLLGLA
jgi:uncharacterized protein YkwD